MPWQKPVSSFSGVFISQGQHDKTLALMSAWLQENVLTDDEMMYEAVCAEEDGDDERLSGSLKVWQEEEMAMPCLLWRVSMKKGALSDSILKNQSNGP